MTELEATLELPRVGNDSAVLCVDDEPQVLSALQRMLRREPYEVLRAGGGLEALDLLERFPIKVVVTDERMPTMTGSELLSKIRSLRPEVGRIILTGYPGPAVMIRSLEAGIDFLMTKPWDEEKLKRTIRRLMFEVNKGSGSPWELPPEPWCDYGGEGG